jgi:hypothetical protein
MYVREPCGSLIEYVSLPQVTPWHPAHKSMNIGYLPTSTWKYTKQLLQALKVWYPIIPKLNLLSEKKTNF